MVGFSTGNSSMNHKYDPGIYSVETFTSIGRKRKTFLVRNFTNGQRMANSWKRRTGGSAVVRLTMYNTEVTHAKTHKLAKNPRR